tara:strand:+ start:2872 stop:3987 length:1116 start_codon:yes stop_codon:yes gene_type:complete
MTDPSDFEIFLTAPPGLEMLLREELVTMGFDTPQAGIGGVTIKGGWADVWRANLESRCASRVIARLGEFRVVHLAQLDTLSRRFDWGQTLRPDIPVRVDVICKGSRIYHEKAAAQRIATAITEELGCPIDADAPVRIMARIDNNLCTLSVDTSGELLHRRGYKLAIGKAPIRETLAALFLRACDYDGSEPVLDPMCGSGTFVIEAAQMAAGLAPGGQREFAFEHFRGFDASAWARLKDSHQARPTDIRVQGSDQNANIIVGSRQNAQRAGVAGITNFDVRLVGDIQPPDGPPGLVIVNPPYGARIGNKAGLRVLYATLGRTLLARFKGWRVGLVTSDTELAKMTGLPFGPPGPVVDHGGLGIRLYRTEALR